MKNHDFEPFTRVIRQILAGPLADPDAIHLAEPATTSGEMPYGFHCHDAWELFCPLRGNLQFTVAGCPQVTIPNRHLLIVPPGCLHIAVDMLPQPRGLTMVVMNLPGTDNPYGGLDIGSIQQRKSVMLSPAELAAWTTCVGTAPEAMMEQAVQGLTLGVWGRERALGLLRVLITAYAEVITNPQYDGLSLDARRVAKAQLFLQSHYFQPTLSVDTVAAALGLSASHFGVLFQKTTGSTLHQALIDLRLRRATDLLKRTTLSIKEIATMTGWSNQLYFSAACHRRLGCPPSALRTK